MGNLKFVVCSLLLSTMAVGQYVVTVPLGTCLPSLGSISFVSTGGPSPSALPAGAVVTPSQPCVTRIICVVMGLSNLEQRIEYLRISPYS